MLEISELSFSIEEFEFCIELKGFFVFSGGGREDGRACSAC
jgi:hypothetical protein